jgi:hypothetical protein
MEFLWFTVGFVAGGVVTAAAILTFLLSAKWPE